MSLQNDKGEGPNLSIPVNLKRHTFNWAKETNVGVFIGKTIRGDKQSRQTK